MPSANRTTTPIAVDEQQIEARYAPLDGYTVGFETFIQDADAAPLFKGLPEDRCQCPHWGVVTSGQVTFRWADREETYGEGDAYYAPPGHIPRVVAGTSLVEFSPSVELERTMAAVEANLSAMNAIHARVRRHVRASVLESPYQPQAVAGERKRRK
jgi:hypothetical protein